ncbi:hypothetical protein D3C71_1644550 [compost metagenome]
MIQRPSASDTAALVVAAMPWRVAEREIRRFGSRSPNSSSTRATCGLSEASSWTQSSQLRYVCASTLATASRRNASGVLQTGITMLIRPASAGTGNGGCALNHRS